MAQQPDQTNPANSEQMLASHTGQQDIRVPAHDDIEIKVNQGGTDAQRQASAGFNGR
jgi:hypothetical protein